MDGTLLKNKHKVIELVNAKIDDIYKDVHEDGGAPVMDDGETQVLHWCMEILDACGEIKHRHHDMKMDYAEKAGNPYGNPGPVEAAKGASMYQPHGHGYGTVQFTTM